MSRVVVPSWSTRNATANSSPACSVPGHSAVDELMTPTAVYPSSLAGGDIPNDQTVHHLRLSGVEGHSSTPLTSTAVEPIPGCETRDVAYDDAILYTDVRSTSSNSPALSGYVARDNATPNGWTAVYAVEGTAIFCFQERLSHRESLDHGIRILARVKEETPGDTQDLSVAEAQQSDRDHRIG